MSQSEGILDKLDRKLGRFSDSDGTNGKRRRSFGATIFFWLCLPMVFLILCVGASTIIVALSGRSTVPKSLILAYDKCLKVSTRKSSCRPPMASKGSIGKIDLGWGPWVGCGLLVVIGFLYSIWRRKQDFDRFKQTADVLSVYVNKGEKAPSVILDSFKGVAEKMLGALPTSEKLDDKKKTEAPITDPH